MSTDFLESSVFLMPNWKWIFLFVLFLGGLFFRSSVQQILSWVKNSLQPKVTHRTFWRHWLQLNIERTFSWLIVTGIWWVGIDMIETPLGFQKYGLILVKILFAFYLIRALYISVDAFHGYLIEMAARTKSSLDDQLAPFATKTLKVLILLLGTLITLQNFGVNVMSLLAGLGLGGLALALAAQDTAANLFGSITILLDNPFKVGDHIRVSDTEGIVEEVGFRSTRIRTPTNTLVTIPNSVVAKEKIENLGERPARRVRQTLGLHYNTPPEKMIQFCDEIRYALASEPQIMKDNIVVHFVNYNSSTLDILVSFHILGNDPVLEYNLSQKLFIEFWKIAKKLNVEYAYPTQTVYLAKDML